MAKIKDKNKTINIKYRKAEFEYFLLTRYTAGIVLTGTEIKSIRAGKASFTDSFCSFSNGELWLHNLHISHYLAGSYNNHEPKRDRKLLLTKRELRKIQAKLNEKGFTVVPISLYINENGYAKVDIAIARGKKMYDKREAIEKRDNMRTMNVEL
ncbi:MAG: SsrA-binding protein SmpB [Bacteroidales bacterium]|nr:SsrA-binding protein SmpB [Bacteroidales bacterium]